MSEELLEKEVNVFDLFESVQETYEQAEEKAKAEAGRPQVDRFSMKDDGTYAIRILPIVPVFDKETGKWKLDRSGFEYPVRQMFLDIEVPAKKAGAKPKIVNIPVIRIDDPALGDRAFSTDLIQVYSKVAKDKYADDEEIVNLINKGGFEHGLKWASYRPMYILDDSERDKGPKLFMASYSQYKDINDARMRLWEKFLKKDKKAGCPISSIKDAYLVEVTRKTENKNTKYKFEIDLADGKDELTEDELKKLMDMPSLPEQLYRFTRYQFEAEIEFLKQYDKRHDIDVMSEPEIKEAIETIKGELPKDDTSHFSLESNGDDSKDGAKKSSSDTVTFEDLDERYNELCDKGLDDSSDEGNELREDIRKFIEDNELNVKVSHRKSTEDLLDDVYNALQDKPSAPAKAKKVEEEEEEKEEAPAEAEKEAEESEKAEEEPAKEESKAEESEKAKEEPEAAPEEHHRARRRPTRADAEATEEEAQEEKKEEEAPAEEEAAPRVRRRRARPTRE